MFTGTLEDRAVPGHWEGDLLRAAGNSHVVTLVERRSRFCMLVKTPGKDSSTVVAVLSRHVGQLPAELRRSHVDDDSKCPVTGKRKYETEGEALSTAAHQKATANAPELRAYVCQWCSAWHLTKSTNSRTKNR